MKPNLLILMLCTVLSLHCKADMPAFLYANAGARVSAGKVERKSLKDYNPDDLELAPDFTLPDVTGADFTLSTLKGKYVVLDFWGTWCGWCLKAMPKMKTYHEKYKDRMVIVGLDCGDTTAKWKAAVQVLKLPWINVQVGRDNAVSRMYHVSGFPTKVVIDPNGCIAKKFSGEDPRFYMYLDKLFK